VLWLIGEAYYRYSGEEGMGGGDVKMLAMIGAFLGWELVIVALVFSSIAGSLTGLLLIVTRRGGLKYALPYGTFLAMAAVVASLYGTHVVTWYTALYYP
jgi:leader peptidase (prepilin peptidase)/N-methyltransferase